MYECIELKHITENHADWQ